MGALAALLLAIAIAPQAKAYQTQYAVLIILDGIRYCESFGDDPAYRPAACPAWDGTSHDLAPNMMNVLAPQGSLALEIYNMHFTETMYAVPSITTGTHVAFTGKTPKFTKLPSIYEYARKELGWTLPQVRHFTPTIAGSSWYPVSEHKDYGSPYWPTADMNGGADDTETYGNFRAMLLSTHPRLATLHIWDIDHYGHLGEWDNYKAAIANADALMLDLWNSIQADSTLAGKTSLFITTDHGRNCDPFDNHDFQDDCCRHVMLLALGPDFKKNYKSSVVVDQRTIAATIAELFGLAAPYIEGTVFTDILYTDAVAPTVIDNQAGDDSWRAADPGAIFDVDFSDEGGSYLDNAQYTVWSGPGMTGSQLIGWTNIADAIAAASYTANWGVDFSSLIAGSNYVSARAYDGSGNVSAPATDAFYIKADQTGPSAVGSLNDGPGADLDVQTANASLSANWSPSADAESGLALYWVSVGTSAGASNVVSWTNNGLATTATLSGLSLADGQTYYVNVKPQNNAGGTAAAASSDGILVDGTAPSAPGAINDGSGADIDSQGSTTQLSANWTASADGDSGIAIYWLSVGTTPGASNTVAWTNGGASPNAALTGLTLSDGQTYYFSVKAQNGADLTSGVATSDGVTINSSTITDPAPINDGAAADIDVQISTTALSANWSGASSGTGIALYWHSMGTSSGASNTVPWTNGGLALSVTETGLSLADGQTYYVSVRAQDNAGFLSNVVSTDGVLADGSAPAAPAAINDGSGADIDIQTDIASISANWAASIDAHSGTAGYWTQITNAPAASSSIVLGWRWHAGTAMTAGGLSLSGGATYYVHVAAQNNVGLVSGIASTDGILVDATAPTGPASIADGAGLDIDIQTDASSLAANWAAASDSESGVAGYWAQITDAAAASSSIVLDWTWSATTAFSKSGLSLTDGKKYYVHVAAQNAASQIGGIISSDGVVVDASPPSGPASANDGDWEDIEYTSSTSELPANWTSASDAHSGIAGYWLQFTEAPGASGSIVVGWTWTTAEFAAMTGLSLSAGVTYYAHVAAQNGAGLLGGIVSTNGVLVDITPPDPPATINDGTGADADFQASASSLSANWTAATDLQSGVYGYWYQITDAPGASSSIVVGWTWNDGTSVTATGLSLTNGATYYVHVVGQNTAGQTGSAASTDGVMIDAAAYAEIAGCDAVMTANSTLAADIYMGGAKDQCIRIAADSITLDCQGHAIVGNGMRSAVFIANRSGVTVKNCSFSRFEYGIDARYSSNLTIQDNVLESNYKAGLRFYQTSGSTISGNKINANLDRGIELSYSDGNALTGNILKANSGYGIYVSGAGNSIDGNEMCHSGKADIFSSAGAGAGDNNVCDEASGYKDAGAGGCSSACASLASNAVLACGTQITADAVLDYDLPPLTAADVKSGKTACVTIAADGVQLDCRGHKISGSAIVDNGGRSTPSTSNSRGYGILLQGKKNATVRNCEISYFSVGISIPSGSENAGIYDNAIAGNENEGVQITGDGYYGIAKLQTIQGNSIDRNGRDGVFLHGAAGVTIDKNTLKNNGQRGIRLESYSINNAITDNVVSGSMYGIEIGARNSNGNTAAGNASNGNQIGIGLTESSNNTLSGNNANDNTKYGIYLVSNSNNNNIFGNLASGNGWSAIAINNANDNRLENNGACGSSTYADIRVIVGAGNAGDGNACDSVENYSDDSAAGCSSSCGGESNCGIVVSTDTTLSSDYVQTGSEDCIVIAADGVTLDCNNRSLRGLNKEGAGIYFDGLSNVTILNCDVSMFNYGIHESNSSGSLFSGNTLSYNNVGLYIDPSYDNTASGNDIFKNDLAGVHLADSYRNLLLNNLIHENGAGVLLENSPQNRVATNQIYGNSLCGVEADPVSSSSQLDGNLYANNNPEGISEACFESGGTEDIPTLGEWAVIALICGFGAVGIFAIRRKRSFFPAC